MHLLKNLIILLLIALPNLAFANEYSSIDYTISPVLVETTPVIKVVTRIRGRISAKLVLDLPYKWASASFVEQINNVRLSNAAYKFSISKKNHHKLTIELPKGVDDISISY